MMMTMMMMLLHNSFMKRFQIVLRDTDSTAQGGVVSNWVSTTSVTSRVAVVMTDGNSNVDSERTLPEAVALHQAGVHVITVSVGQIRNETELRAIASLNGTLGNMFHAHSYDHLEALASAIPAAICNGQSTLAGK